MSSGPDMTKLSSPSSIIDLSKKAYELPKPVTKGVEWTVEGQAEILAQTMKSTCAT